MEDEPINNLKNKIFIWVAGATLIVDVLLVILIMLRNTPEVSYEISSLMYVALFFLWLTFLSGMALSAFYFARSFRGKSHFYQPLILLLFNLVTLVIIFKIPLAQKWNSKVFVKYVNDYEVVAKMAMNGELKAASDKYPRTFPNHVSVSYFELPHSFKHLAQGGEIFRWDNTTVILFIKEGFVGHVGGVCYTSVDKPIEKIYQPSSPRLPRLILTSGSKLLPHWYKCSDY